MAESVLHHVGVTVSSPAEATGQYGNVPGSALERRHRIQTARAKMAFVVGKKFGSGYFSRDCAGNLI